ncbi:MAG: hypothetical protein ACTTJZ_02480 [Sphaerochaetaceae bacterium]
MKADNPIAGGRRRASSPGKGKPLCSESCGQPFHQDVFYPAQMDFQTAQPSCRLSGLPCGILVPHAHHSLIKILLEQAFGYAVNLEPQTILILSSLHRNFIADDNNLAAVTTPQMSVKGSNWSVNIRQITPSIPGIGVKLSYFQEEPGCEELYPILSQLFPHAGILPLLAPCDAAIKETPMGHAHQDKLKPILKTLMRRFPNALVIVSSNAVSGKDCGRMWLDALGWGWKTIAEATGNPAYRCAYSEGR